MRCRWLFLVVAVVGLTVRVADRPAAATSCNIQSTQSIIESAILRDATIFLGQETSATEAEDGSHNLTLRIDRLIRQGRFVGGESLTVWTLPEFGRQSVYRNATRVFLVVLDDKGDFRLAGGCGGDGSVDPQLFEWINSGGLEAPAGGVPKFVVASSLPWTSLTLVNNAGEVVAYGEGDNRVYSIVACPGGDLIAVLTSPLREHLRPELQDFEWTVEVRESSTLKLVASHSLRSPDPTLVGPDEPLLRDLECHARDGSILSLMALTWAPDLPDPRAHPGDWELKFNAHAVIVRSGETVEYDLGVSRSMAFDPVTETVYAVTGVDGRNLTTVSGDGTVNVTALPETYQGWKLELVDGGFTILARLPFDINNPPWPLLAFRLDTDLNSVLLDEPVEFTPPDSTRDARVSLQITPSNPIVYPEPPPLPEPTSVPTTTAVGSNLEAVPLPTAIPNSNVQAVVPDEGEDGPALPGLAWLLFAGAATAIVVAWRRTLSTSRNQGQRGSSIS